MNASHVGFRRKNEICAVNDGLSSSAALLLLAQLLNWGLQSQTSFGGKKDVLQCMLYIAIFKFANKIQQVFFLTQSTPSFLVIAYIYDMCFLSVMVGEEKKTSQIQPQEQHSIQNAHGWLFNLY